MYFASTIFSTETFLLISFLFSYWFNENLSSNYIQKLILNIIGFRSNVDQPISLNVFSL